MASSFLSYNSRFLYTAFYLHSMRRIHKTVCAHRNNGPEKNPMQQSCFIQHLPKNVIVWVFFCFVVCLRKDSRVIISFSFNFNERDHFFHVPCEILQYHNAFQKFSVYAKQPLACSHCQLSQLLWSSQDQSFNVVMSNCRLGLTTIFNFSSCHKLHFQKILLLFPLSLIRHDCKQKI